MTTSSPYAESEKKERFSRLKKVGRKIVHVLNPVSGSSKYYEAAKKTVEEIGGDVLLSEYHGHITELVENTLAKDPSSHIVVYGGDGSLYEACNGIMNSGANSTALLSVIPSGSGNDFSSYANNSDEFPKGESKKIDIIKTTCADQIRYFGNMMNIGFDCSVVDNTFKIRKTGLFKGPSAYIAGLVKELVVKKTTPANITLSGCVNIETGIPCDDINVSKNILLTAAANGKFCGGGFKAAPLANLNDGLMDVLVIDDVTRMKFISLVKYYRSGTFIDDNGELISQISSVLSYNKCKKMTITGMPRFCLDGELFETEGKELVAEVIPEAINFVAV